MKWLLVAAFISLPPVTSAVKLQLSLPESLDVTEGQSVTLACSFSPPSTDLSDLFISWVMIPTGYPIYDSHLGNLWLEIAEFAGNEEKGDCSIRLLNISRNLGPVLKCHVYCYHCGTDDWKVEREVKLNVTAAAPRSQGGTSGTTVAPEGETSATPVVEWWCRVLQTMLAMGVTLGLGAVIVTCIPLPQQFGSSLHSRSGDGQADVHGDVEVNGHLLMMVIGHKGKTETKA
ncbi:uncharacterized protein LOC133339656 [Lethenteron reissneri]|uniref:uncharacterized protein LOC133339656 n=1 Tax=Lethenteron reissneri TaxID=7753 RepID=UPI002AB66B7B|nr:uncharacterized protein LOC133339656 [Lethenteron reissneri]